MAGFAIGVFSGASVYCNIVLVFARVPYANRLEMDCYTRLLMKAVYPLNVVFSGASVPYCNRASIGAIFYYKPARPSARRPFCFR